MKKLFLFLSMLLSTLLGCAFKSPAPKGQLTYCSYSRTGHAGLGKDYCELIADVDSVPKVVVVLGEGNRFGNPVIRGEYSVSREVVDSLQKDLADREVHKLAGYSVDEAMTGGHTYRIYMEYSSGEKVNAWWYGHDIKEEAIMAYNFIERFFAPWREKASTELVAGRIREMEERFDRLSAAVKKGKRYPQIEDDFQELERYLMSHQWQRDYEADERGLLPANLKRGVLGQDALYDLLGRSQPLLGK